MEVSEILARVAWQILRTYTICSMFCRETYNNYLRHYIENMANGETEEEHVFPFNIIEKDGFVKIIYPNFVIADYKFLQTQVEYEGQKHDIEMDKFMVVGNRVLDRPFVTWVMNEQHDIFIEDDEEYAVHVMDQNVDMFSLTDKDYIEINKDNYLKKCQDE